MPVTYDQYDYLAYWERRDYESFSEKIAVKRFLKKIGKPENIVEIGGGFGRLVPFYASVSDSPTLTDPSINLLNLAKKRLSNYPKIIYKEESLPNLSFPDQSFRLAILVRVIHHFYDLDQIFKEINRILVPGGYFILEFANKIHFLARLKALFKGDLEFYNNREPVDRRSSINLKKDTLPFLNHHPKSIKASLEKSNFEIIEILSVSNYRNPIIKKIVPLSLLLFLEAVGQIIFAKLYFGPSIFVLVRKAHST